MGNQRHARIYPKLVHQVQRSLRSGRTPAGRDAGFPVDTWTLRYVAVGGVGHWLWRAVDERRTVLDVFLPEHRETEAASAFFPHLWGKGARSGLI
ncbi:DDE-type integrase/transposase/recombinase [Deinococcus humi]|uniref:DDE-type integrase/transposase/recombinase n=1 Tax=Deinococcus humi TaxID=662880 RepID=UPI003CC825BA